MKICFVCWKFRRQDTLEGFLLWTSDAVYECRLKTPPETIFYKLLSQGLSKSAGALNNPISISVVHQLTFYFQSVTWFFLQLTLLFINQTEITTIHLNTSKISLFCYNTIYKWIGDSTNLLFEEPLGKAVGLDLLRMYESAADRYFELSRYGRALE